MNESIDASLQVPGNPLENEANALCVGKEQTSLYTSVSQPADINPLPPYHREVRAGTVSVALVLVALMGYLAKKNLEKPNK